MIPVKKLRELTLDHSGGDEQSKHISAASALLLVDETIFVVADDERQLGIFRDEARTPGRLLQILEPTSADPDESKERKADLESLCFIPPSERAPHGGLLALGSGSEENRQRGAFVELGDDGEPSERSEIDLGPLYTFLRRQIPELNVEGAAVTGRRLHLLQRGNNGDGRNARIELDLDRVHDCLQRGELQSDAFVGVTFYELGRLHGVDLCFSDVSPLEDGRIVFSCSAEDSEGSGDGTTVGSALGVMTPAGEVSTIEPIDIDVKLEGMTAHAHGDRIRALLVTDADDPSTPSPLLEAIF
jgi:hypothetical protein